MKKNKKNNICDNRVYDDPDNIRDDIPCPYINPDTGDFYDDIDDPCNGCWTPWNTRTGR